MKVTIQPGQENITREKLADLEQLLKAATEELRGAEDAEAAAYRTRLALSNRVSDLQKRFDRECEFLRQEATTGTYWDKGPRLSESPRER